MNFHSKFFIRNNKKGGEENFKQKIKCGNRSLGTVKKIEKVLFFLHFSMFLFASDLFFLFGKFREKIFSTVFCLSGKTIDIISIIFHSGYCAKMANYFKRFDSQNRH